MKFHAFTNMHRTSALAFCLALLTCLASALPPPSTSPRQATLSRDFTSAVAALDFATAASIYDIIRESNLLDSTAFQLATTMKAATLDSDFITLDQTSLNKFAELKSQLPVSVRNMVFATTVCLHNLEFNEYLFSPNNDYIHDSNNRNVFLWRVGGVVAGSTWTVENTTSPTDFKFVNVYGEYLYADNSHYYLNRRQVFTFMPSQWPGSNANVWRFVPEGDNVIIVNSWYTTVGSTREYFYASSNVYNFDNNRRRVFEWDSEWGSDKTHIWRIEDCSLANRGDE